MNVRDVLLTRWLFCGSWHVIIQTVLLQFVVSVDWNDPPTQWFVEWFKGIVRLRIVVIFQIQALLSFITIFTQGRRYVTIEPCERLSRFRYMLRKLSLQNVIWLVIYFMKGIVTVIVFSIAFKNHFILKEFDAEPRTYVSETLVLLVLDSIWIHFLLYWVEYAFNRSIRYFPVVRNNSWLNVPAVLMKLKESLLNSFYYTLLYTVFYFVKGYAFYRYACSVLSVHCDASYTILLTPSILYYLFVLNLFIYFNDVVMKSMLESYMLEVIDFPITNEEYGMILGDAVSMHKMPLVQYLAYTNLNIISHFLEAKRRIIFSLSFPGGQPYVWEGISQEALKLITTTINQLNELTSEKKPAEPDPVEPTIIREHFASHMRPLSSASLLPSTKESDSMFKNILCYVGSMRLFSYFAREVPERTLELALQQYQSLSLACSALAGLAVASRTEDRYGVVQQELSFIVDAMVRLYTALNRLDVALAKCSQTQEAANATRAKRYVAATVKCCLYQLAAEFGSSMHHLALDPETEPTFRTFVAFKQ